MGDLGGFRGLLVDAVEKAVPAGELGEAYRHFQEHGWVVLENVVEDVLLQQMSDAIYAQVDSGRAECSYWDESGKVYDFATRACCRRSKTEHFFGLMPTEN